MKQGTVACDAEETQDEAIKSKTMRREKKQNDKNAEK